MMHPIASRSFRLQRWLLCTIATLACVLGANAQINLRLEPRGVVEKRLKSFARDNQIREVVIRELFARSGCSKANLSEQRVKFGLPPNLICVFPGETPEVIVVGAHTDKVMRAGDGVVDNWSGAALLPSLLFSLSAKTRHHTFVFIGFTAEETSMLGSGYYVDHLMPRARAKIAAIKMDDYYDSYKLIAEYLAYLDDSLRPVSVTKPQRP